MPKIIMVHGIEDKREQYNLLNTPADKMKNHIGERIEVEGFAFIEREALTPDAQPTKVFLVKTKDGELIGTSSKSFVDGVQMFLELLGARELTTFEVGKASSKNGREYLVFKA